MKEKESLGIKPVKRLTAKTTLTMIEKDSGITKTKCLATSTTVAERDVPDLVRKKLFFIRPVIISVKFYYVPCWWVILKFNVGYFNKKHAENGTVDFIVDNVKGCGVIEESLEIKLEKKCVEDSYIAPDKLTEAEAEKKAIVDARWKVLLARYKKPAELETESIRKFYRPYYEVEYTHGKGTKKQWIPADNFGNYFVYN